MESGDFGPALRVGTKLLVTQALVERVNGFSGMLGAMMLVQKERTKHWEVLVVKDLGDEVVHMEPMRLNKSHLSLVEKAPADSLTPEAVRSAKAPASTSRRLRSGALPPEAEETELVGEQDAEPSLQAAQVEPEAQVPGLEEAAPSSEPLEPEASEAILDESSAASVESVASPEEAAEVPEQVRSEASAASTSTSW